MNSLWLCVTWHTACLCVFGGGKATEKEFMAAQYQWDMKESC